MSSLVLLISIQLFCGQNQQRLLQEQTTCDVGLYNNNCHRRQKPVKTRFGNPWWKQLGSNRIKNFWSLFKLALVQGFVLTVIWCLSTPRISEKKWSCLRYIYVVMSFMILSVYLNKSAQWVWKKLSNIFKGDGLQRWKWSGPVPILKTNMPR